jgi:UDP-N-acetylmuramate--alanine ligase
MQTAFEVALPGEAEPLSITLNLPGRHSVLNALAALIVAHELGVGGETCQRALERFQGIGRRFHNYGPLQLAQGRATLIDDYGHHPREIKAVLDAVRAGWPEQRLVLVFQPHRYTRTRDLLQDFAQVLAEADVLVLTEIYPAGEKPLPGADGRSLEAAVRARGREPVFLDRVAALPTVLPGLLRDGDMLLLMGAGDIGAVAAQLGQQGLGGLQ